MYRKILALVICLLMVAFAGCKTKKEVNSEPSEVEVPKEPEIIYYTNNLTGEETLTDKEVVNYRPVAIMVNNAWEGSRNDAQLVQTGLNKADIVYETEVEGGITRLMAVYKDISKVDMVGTIRSARYAYIDLAMGHNAFYLHHGLDQTYAKPHLKDTQTFVVGENNAGVRKKNGMASEHTLYGYGDKIWKQLNKRYDTTLKNTANWQNFADKDTVVSYPESVANTITVKFSSKYRSVFKYDAESGKYVRYFRDILRKDYFTSETESFKNIFVLETSITNYPDNKHRRVELTKGKGYYCVNGTYTPIKWAKGSASNGFKFTLEDGTPLEVNQGNSWVCIHGKQFDPTFE